MATGQHIFCHFKLTGKKGWEWQKCCLGQMLHLKGTFPERGRRMVLYLRIGVMQEKLKMFPPNVFAYWTHKSRTPSLLMCQDLNVCFDKQIARRMFVLVIYARAYLWRVIIGFEKKNCIQKHFLHYFYLVFPPPALKRKDEMICVRDT